MIELTDKFIQELITCDKEIEKADRKNMIEENRSIRNNVYLYSADKKYAFTMFLRKSTEFEEDFSVGLKWTNVDKYLDIHRDIILFRCQGPHDSKKPTGTDIHHSYHVHEITANDIFEYRYTRPAMKETCEEFNSFETALFYFCEKCGIIDLEKYINIDLPNNMQYNIIDSEWFLW